MDIPIPELAALPLGKSASTATALATLPHYSKSLRPTNILRTDATDHCKTAELSLRGTVAASTQADHLKEASSYTTVPEVSPTKVPAPVTAHPSNVFNADHLAEEAQDHIDIRSAIQSIQVPLPPQQ